MAGIEPLWKWPAFDKRLPLPSTDPAATGNLWAVCFDAGWLPYVLGALSSLARADVWDAVGPGDAETATEAAHTLLDLFMEGCGTALQTLIRVDPEGCGIQASYDDGDTWVSYDLSGCIADIVHTGIENAIDNWIIDQFDGQPSNVTQPAPQTCVSFHVQMSGADAWLLPVKLSAGDTVEITNAKGAWCDMDNGVEFPFDWNCPNGDVYILGGCLAAQVPKATDPFQDANHMELILQYGDNHAMPLRGLVTIPGGVVNLDGLFVPNYNRSPLGTGTIQFDVTVCKIGWCHQWTDTEALSTDWVTDQPNWGVYQNQHWETVYVSSAGNNVMYIENTFPTPTRVDTVRLHGGRTGGTNAGNLYIRYYDAAWGLLHTSNGINADWNGWQEWNYTVNNVTHVLVTFQCGNGHNGLGWIDKIQLSAASVGPGLSENCTEE